MELSASDVQSLNNGDAVAALFSRLGYNVNERTEQAPGNLGITAEGTVRPIRRIELIANQEGLLQVYLFELTSVTIAQTRALARVFRNRAGNYLLVLTRDYESLDFVLLEKYLPPESNGGSSLGARQVGIRPRALTVNRRKPGPDQVCCQEQPCEAAAEQRAAGAVRKGLMPVLSRATGKVHEIEASLLKPFLSGEEIRAFSLNHTDLWLLFPYDLSGARPLLLDGRILRERYKGGWDYLKQCELRLRSRERGKMDGPEWWAYIYPKNLDQFKKPKIMLPDYHDRPAAALDLEGRFYSITAYCLTLKKDSAITLPVLACLLNSDLLFWVLSKIGTALQRGFVRFMPQYLDRLPVVVPDPKQQLALEEIARRVEMEGFTKVQAELNEVVKRIFSLTERETAAISGETT